MAEEVQPEKKSGKGLIITLSVVVLLLAVGMGVMATMLMGSESNGSSSEQVVAESTSPYKEYPAPPAGTPPSYFEMKFVVNFKGEGKARFLAVDLKFMSRHPELIEDLEHIRPILQNDLQMLLRQQTYTELSQDSGQEVLRQRILEVGRAAAESNGLNPEYVQNVFLTRFVMQ